MVVLGALRQRLKGWKPAGPWSLRGWGIVVNIAALAYGVFAMILLSRPADSGSFFADWIVLIALVVVLVAGFICHFIARPDRKSDAPEGDAIAVAEAIRSHRSNR